VIITTMSATPQKRTLKNHRKRLKRLADNRSDSAPTGAAVRRTVSGEPPKKGGIPDALRRSPLVGAGLDIERPAMPGRKFHL